MLRDWVAGGAPYRIEGRSEVTGLRMEPAREVMVFDQQRPLRVIASYSDGREDDVTRLAMFHSNNTGLADADEHGVVLTGAAVVQATIMARFSGQIATFQATIPRPGPRADFPENTGVNAIDPLLDAHLRRMNLRPSGVANDAEFLRRAYLGIIGRVPTASEARGFLAETSEGKRARLVETLLAGPDYAPFWALKWADLLLVDRLALSPEEAFSYYSWIRDAVAANQPLDVFARELLVRGGAAHGATRGLLLQGREEVGRDGDLGLAGLARGADHLRAMPSASV